MVYQTELDKNISNVACYFTSIAFRRAAMGYCWYPRDLDALWYQCVKKNYIDVNQFIINPQGICDMLETKLVFKGKFYTDYKVKPTDYIIGCFKMTPIANEAHFTVMDDSGIYTKEHVLFDPWSSKGSKTVREGICTSLRVFGKE